MKLRIKESSIPSELITSVATKMSYDWDPTDTEPIYMCVFTAIARFLGVMKSKDAGKVALRINDYKGNLLMASIVTFTENDDPNMPGNWSLSFTFDPEDLKEVTTVHSSNDIAFHKVLADVTLELISYRYINTQFEDNIVNLIIETLKDCLDKNANPTEPFILELPEIFEATVTVEDDHKIFEVSPSSKLSRIIKGDGDIEV